MENIIVNIDSRYRDTKRYPNGAKFIYTLSENLKNCKYIRLSSIELPNLYFTFAAIKKNISFTITCNTLSHIITLDDGMYTPELLLNSIQHQFDVLNELHFFNFKINFNIINGFINIENSKTFKINFSNYPSDYESLGFHLGFRKFIYESTYNKVDKKYYIKSEAQLDTIGDAYLFLRINDYGIIYHDFKDITAKQINEDNLKDLDVIKKILEEELADVRTEKEGYKVDYDYYKTYNNLKKTIEDAQNANFKLDMNDVNTRINNIRLYRINDNMIDEAERVLFIDTIESKLLELDAKEKKILDELSVYNYTFEEKKIQGKKDLLAKIILNGNKTEQIFDNGSNYLTKSYIFKQPVDIRKFDIELLDPKGNIVDMNFMDYSFSLEIGIIYDSQLKNDLTYNNVMNTLQLTNMLDTPVLKELTSTTKTKQKKEKIIDKYNKKIEFKY
jgi:hypothetical protein